LVLLGKIYIEENAVNDREQLSMTPLTGIVLPRPNARLVHDC
jgi:hypothetical protein